LTLEPIRRRIQVIEQQRCWHRAANPNKCGMGR